MFLEPFSHQYQSLNLITVNSQALAQNFFYFESLNPQARIAPVLKSNAYGHGLVLVGRMIDRCLPTAPFVAVDSLYEAWELEKAGIKKPILVIGYTNPGNFRIRKKLRFHLPLFDDQTALVLARYQPRTKFHIKIDSGMNRLGLKPDQIAGFIRVLKENNLVNQAVGIYSHLSCADNPVVTQKQVAIFKAAIRQFEDSGFKFIWKHIAASLGALVIRDPEFNLIRLGLGFYGHSLLPVGDQNLRPALKLVTHLAQIKKVNPGESVGYGNDFRVLKRMILGALPLGYYDGLPRSLSGRQGAVKVGQQYCPIVGRICMNITMIDLTGVKNVAVGQEVTVISDCFQDQNSLAKLASLAQTIPPDLLVGLSETTRRRLV